ncbi:hypothetical protein [Microbulbifer sp.]|uniref:hypothetical protein n=1 Tax=Microbulbifer sp. TaxID=1908541 RepID=UPI003F40FF46
MNKNRLRSTLITVAALLALLLQVQMVFACEMMEHSGPVSECCCDHMAPGGQEPDSDCCTLDSRISLKAEAQDQQAVLPAAQLALELPQLTAVPPGQWPPIPPPLSTANPKSQSDPSHPGSRTWLVTLRLRI